MPWKKLRMPDAERLRVLGSDCGGGGSVQARVSRRPVALLIAVVVYGASQATVTSLAPFPFGPIG